MMASDQHDWMWSEALSMLAKAERMHQQMFQPVGHRPQIAWEPPVDVLETEREVQILVALPGVDVEGVEVVIDGADLVVAGRRILPTCFRTAIIHRLEIPQGRFERRMRLPPGHYADFRRTMVNGCLVVTLQKGETL